jgi:hypothetical protein
MGARPPSIALRRQHRVATDVERVLGGVAPHLMVTDPPYGVNYDLAWRKQAGRLNGTTYRIAAGTVIKPIGGEGGRQSSQ